MSKILQTKTQQITIERTVKSFGVTIPDDGGTVRCEVAFSELSKDDDGNIVVERPLPHFIISQDRLLELLPNEDLPSFSSLYSGLSKLFHDEYTLQQNPPIESFPVKEPLVEEPLVEEPPQP